MYLFSIFSCDCWRKPGIDVHADKIRHWYRTEENDLGQLWICLKKQVPIVKSVFCSSVVCDLLWHCDREKVWTILKNWNKNVLVDINKGQTSKGVLILLIEYLVYERFSKNDTWKLSFITQSVFKMFSMLSAYTRIHPNFTKKVYL